MAGTGGANVPIETGSVPYGKPEGAARQAAKMRLGRAQRTYGKTGGVRAPSASFVPKAVAKEPYNPQVQKPA